MMDFPRRAELLTRYRDGLLQDVVPFWLRHGVDREHGGVLTCLDRDGSLLDSDKGVWQQGRFAWLLGELYNNVERNPAWLDAATHTCQFLKRCGIDPIDDRMWFQVTREGAPLRKRRYAFSEAFAAIAFGELAQATGEQSWADLAAARFRRFLEQSATGASPPKSTGLRPAKSIGVPMITINAAQELRDSIGLAGADGCIDRAIDEIERDFVKHDLRCVMETVAPDGGLIDHFDGRTLNPGHAIEGAWFILEEARHRADERMKRLGVQMLDYMWRRGWDEDYGGMLYFRDVNGRPVQEYWHDMKFWWPQAETLIATLLAYEATGDAAYLNKHLQLYDWVHRHFPDDEQGEWFGYLHRDGRLSVPLKGNLWKGPFHIPRMQLVCWRALEPRDTSMT